MRHPSSLHHHRHSSSLLIHILVHHSERLSSSSSEVVRVGAAYSLASRGCHEVLAEALAGPAEAARRAACWGCGAAGPGAVAVLTPLLSHTDPLVVAHAANALGSSFPALFVSFS